MPTRTQTLSAIALLASLVGGSPGAAPVPAQAGKPLPAELALIPPDAAAVHTTRVRAALAALPPAPNEPVGPELWARSVLAGAAAGDVERVTVIVPPDKLPAQAKRDPKRPTVSPDPVSTYDVPPEARFVTLVLTTRKPLARPAYQIPSGMLGCAACRTGRTATHRGHTFALDDDGWTAWLKVGDRTWVFGSRASVEWVIDQLAGHAKPGPLGPALYAMRDCDMASVIHPRFELQERFGEFPAFAAGDGGQVFARGLADWLARAAKEPATAPEAVAVGVNLAEDRVTVWAGYPTERAAEQWAGALKALRADVVDRAAARRAELLGRGADRQPAADALDALVGRLRPLDEPAASGRLASATLQGVARPLLGDPADLRTRLRCVHDLPMSSSTVSGPEIDHETYHERQVVRALDAYHTKHGRYPDVAIGDRTGKPLLSWRVALLPHLGFEDLYKRFKLEEPWDSTHNAKLLTEIPWPYSDGESIRFRHRPVTRLHLPVGPGTLFEGGKGSRKADATDGADQTVLLLKLDRPVPWTKPEDAAVAAGKALTVGGAAARVCGFCTADGKARCLEQFVLLGGRFDVAALLTRAGGEPKPDIDKTLSGAILAAGVNELDFAATMGRVFKEFGIEVPDTLPPPRPDGKP